MNNSDAQARANALDIRTSFIVEAPAGSGKTGLLIQRYMKLLLDEQVEDPSQVLAITFTVKATEEIRTRVLEALHRAAAKEVPKNEFDAALLMLAQQVLDRDRRMQWQIMQRPARMNIRTIDALASQIARTLPFLSGGLGTLQPAQDAMPLYRSAARRVIAAMGGDDPLLHDALRTVLLHRDANLGDVEKLLSDMLAVREQWAKFVPISDNDLDDAYLEATLRPAMDQALAREICTRIQRIDALLSPEAKQRIARLANELCADESYTEAPNYLIEHCRGKQTVPGIDCTDLPAWLALQRLLTTEDGWRKSLNANFVGLRLSKYNKEQLLELIEYLRNDALHAAFVALQSAPPYPYPEDQWQVAKPLFRLLRQALAELQIVFAEAGRCDFTEVAIAARNALTHGDGVRDLAAALGTRLQHLLMDEMQDTSSSQYDLLKQITAGWDGSSQTVFLVGDPKQSIYIFREARVDLFLRALRTCRLGSVPLTPIALTANFRSQAQLVNRFNDIFGSVFVEGQRDGIVYSAAEASLPSNDGDLHWHLARKQYIGKPTTPTQAASVKTQHRAWECSTLTQVIQEWRSRPLHNDKPWKIAVLVRTRNHAAALMSKLRDEGIPVRAVEIDALQERPEVLDLIALTRALLHLADRTAWLAVLHAPWCGLGVADLHRLTAGDDVARKRRSILAVAEERLSTLSPAVQQRAQQTLAVIRSALQQQGRMPLAQWIERTWRSLGGDSYLNAVEYANCLRYFAMLQDLTADGTTPAIADLEAATAKLYAESNATDAVEILTIHKAKGLEWDLVLVPALERSAMSDRASLLNWTELFNEDGTQSGLLLAPIQSKGNDATHLDAYIASLKKQRKDAEVDRMFYVAATRARHALHLFAAPAELKSGTLRRVSGTLLDSAWNTVADQFEEDSITRFFIEEENSSRSNLIEMPSTSTQSEPLALAAVAEQERSQPLLRVPDNFNALARFPAPKTQPSSPAPLRDPSTLRPQGSLVSRALGDTAHVFLEAIAKQLSSGQTSADEIDAAIENWQPRVANFARSHGLDDTQIHSVTTNVMRVLHNILHSETGRWLLAPHPEADTERAFVIVSDAGIAEFTRVDRLFLAAATPLSTGSTHRWIVDFKTGERTSNIEAYLETEKNLYADKMQAYASTASKVFADEKPIMLALYYPLMDRLIFWEA